MAALITRPQVEDESTGPKPVALVLGYVRESDDKVQKINEGKLKKHNGHLDLSDRWLPVTDVGVITATPVEDCLLLDDVSPEATAAAFDARYSVPSKYDAYRYCLSVVDVKLSRGYHSNLPIGQATAVSIRKVPVYRPEPELSLEDTCVQLADITQNCGPVLVLEADLGYDELSEEFKPTDGYCVVSNTIDKYGSNKRCVLAYSPQRARRVLSAGKAATSREAIVVYDIRTLRDRAASEVPRSIDYSNGPGLSGTLYGLSRVIRDVELYRGKRTYRKIPEFIRFMHKARRLLRATLQKFKYYHGFVTWLQAELRSKEVRLALKDHKPDKDKYHYGEHLPDISVKAFDANEWSEHAMKQIKLDRECALKLKQKQRADRKAGKSAAAVAVEPTVSQVTTPEPSVDVLRSQPDVSQPPASTPVECRDLA